ncbi:tail fiber assembly protein [Rahnella sp. SL6]|uniref:tail fiber assembly protein n=1 Tax=Rahnella perminowiae TaxID=2816244 RepID=UPI001C272A8C|nr:tail fiber assembly protein [Rahnella perminowiae]MBU9812393.1 tail fiber assembly protein [Rahnella perminowiae]
MNVSDYAVINSDGEIINVVLWDGETDWTPPDGSTAIKVNDSGAGIGWTYKSGVFTAPPLTDDQIAAQNANKLADNLSQKTALMDFASERTSVLQDAVDLDMATDAETAALPLWKKYRVLLSRIDANTSDDVVWPTPPTE